MIPFEESHRTQAYDYILEAVAPRSNREEVADIISAIALAARLDEEQILARLALQGRIRERGIAAFGG